MRKSYIDEECILGCLERLVEEYIEQEDYKYKFDFEFSNNHDVETSILSKMIFMRLLEIDKSKVKCIFLPTIRIDETKVSFDIMNNPKASKHDFYRLGSIAKRVGASDLFKWEELKYTIGNFAPIPNAHRKGLRHLQFVHNNKNERWDFLLSYCKEHWDDYSCDLYPTFRDYIIKTAQHLYIKDVLEDFKSNLRERQIEDVKTNEFENWVENWDSILRDKSKTCELISFGEKTTNIDNIEEIIELICLLTKTRGRMIISLLKKKNP